MKSLISATIALSLLASTAAVAQYDERGHQSQNSAPRQNRNGGGDNPQGYNNPNSDHPHWSRGDRLPEQYRQDRYAVTDWKSHNLRMPPRGYRWVRNDDNQYLLAAVTTGIIAEIVSQNQYRKDYRWSRGERLSGGYLDRRYIVSDWKANHLRRPRRGYHWVRANDQFLLTAIASGVIADTAVNDR